MYSRLDPIFHTQLRHAETLDTRQGIRRHEDQDERKKRGRKKRENEEDLWQDQTSVSVSALHTFLQQLVRDTETKQPAAQKQNVADENIALSDNAKGKSESHTPVKPDVAQRSTRAAQAYERTYRATHHDAIPAAPAEGAVPAIDLRPEEIRTIHGLIDDLEKLAQRGIETLTLQKSDSFLQSLVDAVQNEKNL